MKKKSRDHNIALALKRKENENENEESSVNNIALNDEKGEERVSE